MSINLSAKLAAFGLILLIPLAASAQNAEAFRAAQLEAKTGATAKMGPVLRALYRAQSPAIAAAESRLAAPAKVARLEQLLRVRDGTVPVDIALQGDAATQRARFESYGLTDVGVYGNRLYGRLPIAALASVSGDASVITVRPSLSKTNVGLTTTQGDKAQRSDDARSAFGLSGRGVKIGVLSDSFNCVHAPLTDDPLASFTDADDDVRNGDLPIVQVLKDLPEPDCTNVGTDEGRAILQILHDVAPGARLAFYTANVSETDFAAGIKALADAGANIIVDDVAYFDEPFFQDGIVAQAVDAVKARGVSYFSSAGNQQRQSYEAPFQLSRDQGLDGPRHNFGTRRSPDTLQLVTLDPGAIDYVILQWDEPYGSISSNGRASRSDLDLIFYDTAGEPIPICDENLEPDLCQFPGTDSNIGADPLEIALIFNQSDSSADINLSIEKYDGPSPNRVKYEWIDEGAGALTVDEYITDSGTTVGHANAAGAEAVGAAPWYNTAEFGSPLWGNKCKPACLEYFSSAGGVPILFNPAGQRLAAPVFRLKPGVTGPDGGNTSFFFARSTDPAIGGGEPDQFPNFFGTSASAPHVAGIAALMLEQMSRNAGQRGAIRLPATRVPDYVFTTLRATASDIRYRAARTIAPYAIERPLGFDFDSGFGFVDAVKAIGVVKQQGVATN